MPKDLHKTFRAYFQKTWQTETAKAVLEDVKSIIHACSSVAPSLSIQIAQTDIMVREGEEEGQGKRN